MISDPLLFPLATAAAGTYEDTPPQWSDDVDLVHVYLSEVNGTHCIAFEGTTDFQEWLVDFLALEIPVFCHPQLGPVHLGFMRDVMSVAHKIEAYLQSLGWPPYYVTGHSKGAGEALLFHGYMKTIGHPPLATRAYEAPRVGSSIMRDYLAGEDIAQTATHNYHGTDIVTRVPFGFTWCDMREPIELIVPDPDDIPTKHKIPAVIAGIASLLNPASVT